jgi:hypothetical protein
LSLSRRKVLGAFRLTVVVKGRQPLLRTLVRRLAVLRYIVQAIPTADSWRPVFDRYIRQLAAQIAGLGLDPSQIPASADDPGLPGEQPGDRDRLTGKVCEVIFDCFGDLEGFVLETCTGKHHFKTTRASLTKLLLTACRKQLTIAVATDDRDDIDRIIVRR